jgi:polyisoprenoid-binding protein YceI
MMNRRLLVLSSATLFLSLTTFQRSGSAQGEVRQAGRPVAPAPAIRLTVAAEGNEARYKVREQLFGNDLPNDAVGKTAAVTGELGLNADGTLAPGVSRFVVDVTGLASDQTRRDNYVRNNVLETTQFRTVTMEPTQIRGLTGPLPTSGTREFDMVGNLTVHGVTRVTTWRTSASFSGDTVSGTTSTAFTFGDFNLRQPRVPIVLSVADTIRLEYDFRFVVNK